MSQLLDPSETAADLDATAFDHLDDVLLASFSTGDFMGAVRLLDAVAEAAELANHHPDVKLGYGTIEFELSSHDSGGVTARDVALALRIQAIADAQGATEG